MILNVLRKARFILKNRPLFIMITCCRLGLEYDKKKNIITESKNFFVVPTIGQMEREGYLLVCSKKHFRGVGHIPKKMHKELEQITEKTKSRLSELYKSDVVVFEHGPRVCSHRGGGCLDHAHLHILTVENKIIPPLLENMADMLNLKQYFKLERISDFSPLSEIFQAQQASYMFIQPSDQKKFVTEVNFQIPSQYMRRVIAKTEGIEDWNWREQPDLKLFERTVKILQDRF